MPFERSRHLLESGNYIRLARTSVEPAYQGIAFILLGRHREGLALLEGCLPSKEADYYRAFAYWCLGDRASATRLLRDDDARHVRLKHLITRRVKVLCQARHDGARGWCISSTLKADPEFDVVTMGNMDADKVPVAFSDDIAAILSRLGDWRPDFYFGHMIEYRLVPFGIEQAPFPLFFQTSDHRSDYLQVLPLVNLCDGFVVLGEQGHMELSRIARTHVFTYPKLFGVDVPLARQQATSTKDIDLFWSGHLFDESIYDKSAFLTTFVSSLEGSRRIAFCPSKTDLGEYYQLLSRAKVVPTYIQHDQDSFSSRALEAIALGAIALVPAGNAAALYFDRATGLVEYTPTDAISRFTEIVEGWDGIYRHAAQAGQERARREFGFPTVINQFFKLLALKSLDVSREMRQPIGRAESYYRLYSMVESSQYRNSPHKLTELRRDNAMHLDRLGATCEDHRLLAGAAYQYWFAGDHARAVAILERLRDGLPHHPGVLFNLAYALFHAHRHAEARAAFADLLTLDPADGRLEHDFPFFDFDSSVFLGRLLRDELCHHAYGGRGLDAVLAYLRSVACNYLADINEHQGDLPAARKFHRTGGGLFPDNFIGRVNCGRFLLRHFRQELEARAEAAAALLDALQAYPPYYRTEVFDLALAALNDHPDLGACLMRERQRLLRVLDSGGVMQRAHDDWHDFKQGRANTASPDQPRLVEEDRRGFNLVAYREKYYGLARGLGPVDLGQVGEETIAAYRERGVCVVGDSVSEVQNLIDHSSLRPTAQARESVLPGGDGAATVPSRDAGKQAVPRAAGTDHPFTGGNYAGVGAERNLAQWQYYAALGLIGKTQTALEGLQRFDDPHARFYAAVTSWIAGDEDAAVRLLEAVPMPHAQRLLALIRKPRIEVLAQLPATRQGPQDLLTGAWRDERFRVRNISFHPQDLRNEPYADIRRYFDSRTPPDFYVCAMVEWHLIPPNLQELPCPILGQTADYDLHIQTVHPWLQVFDALVVTDHTEWGDVRRLTPAPVFTFPKSFVLPERLPPIPRGWRKYDVLQTGTILHPYYPDKGELLQQILANPRLKVQCINGFVGAEEYHTLLASSKAVPTYVRHAGAMPTRGLEALSMGCVVAAQRGSALTLYAGEEEGVVTYDLARGDLPSVIEQVVKQWPEYQPRARRGAGLVRREFSATQVASQYLRFLTFLAARPRPQRQPIPVEDLDQRRRILWKGWAPGDREVLDLMQEQTLARLRARAEREPSPRLLNDLAREMVLAHAAEARDGSGSPIAEETVSQILRFYRAAVGRFPTSLVLRFNLVRTALHFGQAQEVLDALRLAEETIRQPASGWEVDARDDVFPWDFANTFFNYRAYFDLATEHLAGGGAAGGDLVRLILASLNYYLAHYSRSLDHYRAAATLDPGFPYYTLRYARALLETGEAEARHQATGLLRTLAEHSILFLDAQALLETHGRAGGADGSTPAGTSLIARANDSIKIREPIGAFPLQPALVQVTPRTPPRAAPLVGAEQEDSPGSQASAPASARTTEYLVSALVTTYRSERFMRGLLEDLERQTIASRLEIVIVDSHSPENERAIVEEFQRRYRNIVYLRTEERENSHLALNRAIRVARGKYLTLANTDDRHRPDAFEKMAALLEARPEIALVYADSAITDQENAILETARIIGHLRLPEYDRRLLYRGCFVGPQPMWRRALHDRHGLFDPEFQIVGDYELWLRLATRETFAHLPEVLGLYLMSPTSNERANRLRRHLETERARARHWPAEWGDLPPWDSNYNVVSATPPSCAAQGAGMASGETGEVPAAAQARPEASDLEAGHRALEGQAWIEACRAFIRILERDADCPAARSGLGLGLVALGDGEEGLAQLREAVRLEPSPDLVSNLACGLIHLGQLEEAAQLLRGILALRPDHEAARVNLSRLLAAQGNGAGQRVREGSAERPVKTDPAALLESGAHLLAANRWTEAAKAFRSVLAVAPDLAEARAALGSALLVLGRTGEAIVELGAAAERLKTCEAWNNLGWACATARRMEEARDALVKAIEADPTNLEPQRNLAALFEFLEMPADAAAAYDLILLSSPADPEAIQGKARCEAAAAPSAANPGEEAARMVATHG